MTTTTITLSLAEELRTAASKLRFYPELMGPRVTDEVTELLDAEAQRWDDEITRTMDDEAPHESASWHDGGPKSGRGCDGIYGDEKEPCTCWDNILKVARAINGPVH
jgi:hypothetical protein